MMDETTKLPIRRCEHCDREKDNYILFLSPENIESCICWECLQREEKGFNAKRDFRRSSRTGVIPR